MIEASGKRRKEARADDYSYSFRAPEFTASQLEDMHRAAKAFAERNPSDPFAYGRSLCHMRRGIATADVVFADARGIVLD